MEPTPSTDFPSTASRIAKTVFAAILLRYALIAIETPLEGHVIDAVNLIFHEAGHTLLSFAPETITVLGGSLFQILVPLCCAAYLFVTGERYGSGLMVMWSGESLVGVARYAADAFARELPLLGGDGVIHDWTYLSAHLGLGGHVIAAAGAMRAIGLAAIFGGFVLALYWIWGDALTRRLSRSSEGR